MLIDHEVAEQLFPSRIPVLSDSGPHLASNAEEVVAINDQVHCHDSESVVDAQGAVNVMRAAGFCTVLLDNPAHI